MGDMTVDELKDKKLWFLWSAKPGRNGKVTKVPFAANGGATGTDDAHKGTWVPFDDAESARNQFQASGLGLKIPKGFFLLDIDHKDISDPFAQLMLSRFSSYAEVSPSGKGIHIIGQCDITKLPVHFDDRRKRLVLDSEYYQKRSDIRLELYIGDITNRYGTFTGNTINSLPITDCTQAVLTTLDKEMRKKPKAKYSAKRDGDRAVFDIVCDLRKQKNGDKFIRLYDKGDFSEYGSQSEADAALCALIAFRTGAGPDAIDEVFRSSALYRSKWERDDYRENTINAGISAGNGVFHRSKMKHPDFIKFNEQTGEPYVSVPLLAKYIREHLQYILVRDNGKQGLLKYVYEGGCYRLYADNMLLGIIKKYIADYDEELVKMSKVNEVLLHITTDLTYVSQDALNADEDIINFQNGNLKITATDTELIPHSADILSTIQLPCEWSDEDIDTPVFDSYMDTLTNGDEMVKQLLMEFIGVCISNVKGWRMKKALFLVGQGDTGKSQLKRIKEIAGEYGVTVSSVLIGIYAEVISRWSSNKHFTLNLPIQNRPTIGNNTNSIVGDFTAVNLLEVNVTQNMSFIERVKEITKRLMEDLEHNSFSGVEVLRELSKVSEEKELLMPIVFTGVLKTDGTVGTIEYGFSHTPQVWIDCQIVDEIDSEDQEKGLMISINVEEEVNIPSGVTIGNVMLPSVKETFEQIWPDAVKKALEILFKQNRTEKMSMAQYQIYVSKLWSEICQKVGYMNIVDYDNFGDIKSIFYDLEKRHLIKKENDGIE